MNFGVYQYTLYYRLGNLEHVVLGPSDPFPWSLYIDKYKFHPSKEPLYALQTSFMVPKASPLNASVMSDHGTCSMCIQLFKHFRKV